MSRVSDLNATIYQTLLDSGNLNSLFETPEGTRPDWYYSGIGALTNEIVEAIIETKLDDVRRRTYLEERLEHSKTNRDILNNQIEEIIAELQKLTNSNG